MKKKLNIKAVIVDDEPNALKGIVSLLNSDLEIEIIASCSESSKAIEIINKESPDVVFLDIQMPEFNGFDVLEQISLEQMPLIAFITAYDEFALRAFKASAIDYLLKPFDDVQFYKMVEKIKKQYKAEQFFIQEQKTLRMLHGLKHNAKSDIVSPISDYLEHIYVKGFREIDFVSVNEIIFFSADNYYVWVHTRHKQYLIRQTMIYLEQNLDPKKFVRISRSHIIKISTIKKVIKLSQKEYQLITTLNKHFKISYSRLKKLKEVLIN